MDDIKPLDLLDEAEELEALKRDREATALRRRLEHDRARELAAELRGQTMGFETFDEAAPVPALDAE